MTWIYDYPAPRRLMLWYLEGPLPHEPPYEKNVAGSLGLSSMGAKAGNIRYT